ncbi:MAG: UDP-N-acetylmuramoyl-L-alanine--D-glutamate ligase [Butyrivibrio sp.]|nr:UDP-N-acetylmuramoyl-L-alanine--D-glutamate ligase [Butyrivibrio sp.]
MLLGKKREIPYAEEIAGKRVLIVGAGRSGIGSASLLSRAGACPVLLEQNRERAVSAIRDTLAGEDRDKTEIIVGDLPDDAYHGLCAAVISPGVPIDAPVVLECKTKGIPVLSEIELAYRFMKGILVAITGTNGKTTTTALTGEVLKQHWPHGADEVFVVGNIGESFAAHALETTDRSVTVAEISSFQLEAVDRFHARAAAILNVTPDHLDRHHTMENYAAIKERIANRMQSAEQGGEASDVRVLNYMDPYTRAFGMRDQRSSVIWFSSGERPGTGLWLDGDVIRSAQAHASSDEEILRFSECRLKGTCNAENIMASLGLVMALGIRPALVKRTVTEFKPVPHRLEFIASKGGVDWYNDSKATNPDSAIQGITAMDRPTVLIGGGYNKDADYDMWTKCFAGRVKELVLIGETAEAIGKSADKNGFTAVRKADSFDEALAYCRECAQAGDAVLLSPACASWGMFNNYEERGDRFREFVNSLAD